MPASPSPERKAEILRLSGITLDQRDGEGRAFRVLDIPELVVEAGGHLAVSGPSGCGKSSLLHLIAGLLPPGSGRLDWGDLTISTLPEAARDQWRRREIGFVFQDFHLIPELDVAANIALPASFSSWRATPEQKDFAAALAERMGLADPRRRAAVLSRGEQQRVAIARALFNRPTLLLADEPTASLGADQGREVSELLVEAASASGATLVCASHDPGVLALMRSRLDLAPAGAKEAER